MAESKVLRAHRLRAKLRAKRAEKRAALPTANARIIRDLMVTQGVKGNYKDFAVLAGGCVVDWKGTYPAKAEVKSVHLVHKRRLAEVVGDEIAATFWNKATGQRRAPDK